MTRRRFAGAAVPTAVGFGEKSDPNKVKVKIKERVVVRKFDGDWTKEQVANGEADNALAEVLTLEDGVIIDHWGKSDAAGDGAEVEVDGSWA